VQFPNSPEVSIALGDWAAPAPNGQTTAPFQLYVPVGDNSRPKLNALSELMMLSTYAHLYAGTTDTTDLGALTTVSEFLAQSRFYDFSSPGGATNPYMGVLDPTRYILGGDLPAIAGLPDTLKVPLATRIFECFDALPVTDPEGLTQGRININTAPKRVLEMLPFIKPLTPISGKLFPNPAPPSLFDAPSRADAMLAYREQSNLFNFSYFGQTPGVLTQLPGLRLNQTNPNDTAGFAGIGELAILDRWTPPVVTSSPPTLLGKVAARVGQLDVDSFLVLGSDATNDDPAGDPNNVLELVDDAGIVGFDPADDPEERLSVFRAVSNIATTRSDVFIAWFVLRGYDPEQIEQFRINGTTTADALIAMDDPKSNFRPAYESRWLAVLDRSNVTRPTDRPKIVMLVELPSATP